MSALQTAPGGGQRSDGWGSEHAQWARTAGTRGATSPPEPWERYFSPHKQQSGELRERQASAPRNRTVIVTQRLAARSHRVASELGRPAGIRGHLGGNALVWSGPGSGLRHPRRLLITCPPPSPSPWPQTQSRNLLFHPLPSLRPVCRVQCTLTEDLGEMGSERDSGEETATKHHVSGTQQLPLTAGDRLCLHQAKPALPHQELKVTAPHPFPWVARGIIQISGT